MNLKKVPKTAISILFYVLLVIFLVIYIKSIDLSQLANVQVSWWYVIVASVLGMTFRYWGGLIWLVILRGLGAQDLHNKSVLFYIYAKAWLGRYIPGTAPWILAKIHFASQHGISKHKLAVSSLLEGALQIIVVMALAFIMLIFDPRLNVVDQNIKTLLAIVLVVCIILMIPPVFNRMLALMYKIIWRKTLDKEHMASTATVLKGTGLYIIGALIAGFSFFFIAKAVYPELGYDNMLFVMGASNLAGAVGMLAIFAPSGIGVREGIQLVLMTIIMPAEFALLVTVVTRLWSIVIDFLFFAASWLFAKAVKR